MHMNLRKKYRGDTIRNADVLDSVVQWTGPGLYRTATTLHPNRESFASEQARQIRGMK